MTDIRVTEVSSENGWTFRVDVADAKGQSRHEVRVSEADHARFAGEGVPAARLVEESFRFLLEREPKEAILRTFDLPVIERYFPEYGKEMARRLDD